MLQTLFGLGLCLLGLMVLVFNRRLAKSSEDFRIWAFGIRPLIPDAERAGLILVGIFAVVYGLLYATHLLMILRSVQVGPRYCI